MLTNGTGTGKTFSGGGVVARFVRQGKDSILIVAPSQDILKDWKAALHELGVEANILEARANPARA
jgi:superfamily II DNA or RNA helicase